MIYLHKFLPLIVSPLGLVVGFLVLSMIMRRMWPVWWAMVVLVIFALPITAHLLWRGLEADYPYRPVSAAGQHDGVVVLSGMVSGYPSETGPIVQWRDPDRLFAGLELLAAGKAKTLILTQGKIAWSNTLPEGEVLRQTALNMGVSPNQILLAEGIVENTEQEARQIKILLEQQGLNSVLLVTSSFHMPRAKRLFDSEGINSEAFATDFKTGFERLSWMNFIPSAEGLHDSSFAVREYIGRLYYRVKRG